MHYTQHLLGLFVFSLTSVSQSHPSIIYSLCSRCTTPLLFHHLLADLPEVPELRLGNLLCLLACQEAISPRKGKERPPVRPPDRPPVMFGVDAGIIHYHIQKQYLSIKIIVFGVFGPVARVGPIVKVGSLANS